MSFSGCYKIALNLLVGTGFLSVALTQRLHIAWVLFFVTAFIASWAVNTAAVRQKIPTWALNCVAVIYVPIFLWDLHRLSRSMIVASIHLLLYVAAIKLLTQSKDRDHLQLCLISFAQLIAASTLTANLVFGICLLAFLLTATAMMSLSEMRRSYARIRNSAKTQPLIRKKDPQHMEQEFLAPFPCGLFSTSMVGISLLILALAMPLFLFLPRFATNIYSRPAGRTQFVSGFSDSVTLGKGGHIGLSDEVVMRVQTSMQRSEFPEPLRWRGISFDYFDGRSWQNTNRERLPLPTQGRYYKLENSAHGRDWLNQTFFVEGLTTNVIFTANRVLAVSLDVGPLRRDPAGNLFTDSHRLKKIRYSTISEPIKPNPDNISNRNVTPAEISAKYLQLPPLDPRIRLLAERVARNADNPYFRALALEHYLRSNYRYSLQIPEVPVGSDPLASFLFHVRAGHCEYFASSMAVMLRQIGIPARLVNGFRSGEYNSIGNNWVVRQYHAHSWVEAYFPPYGWIEFDPTPTGPQPNKTGLAWLVSDISDALDLWWWENVLNYDSSKQYHILSTMRGILESGRLAMERSIYGILEWAGSDASFGNVLNSLWDSGMLWIVITMLVPVALALMIHGLRRRIRRQIKRWWNRGNDKVIATSFFAEALDLIRDRGFVLKKGQTAMELALSSQNQSFGSAFLALTQTYYRLRFSSRPMHADQELAQKQLQNLRIALKRK